MGAAAGAGALAALGWAGLHVAPAPLPAFPRAAAFRGTVPVPVDVPSPVDRHYRATFGTEVPVVQSAVITARGQLTLAGLSLPARFRFTHLAGKGYRHYIEATWFGIPIMKVNEWFLEGRARLQLPTGTVARNSNTDSAANLALWLESAVWLPSVLVTDPRIRWEPINDEHAALLVPASGGQDRVTVTFDQQTGLIRRLDTLRYKSPKDAEKTAYRGENLEWRTFHGMTIPSEVVAQWLDMNKPAFTFVVHDVVYNQDVGAYIRASGP